MAILFGRVSNITRGSGGSAIKAAAYRSCSNLTLDATDKETNITAELVWDYSKKSGLVYSQIHAPENAPEWVYDRQSLWQRVEDVETKQNARLAGEYTLALPKEFSVEQNIALLKEFAEEVFVSRGIIVDVNFHNDNPNNPHAHCMYVLRELEEKLAGEIDFSNHRCRELQARAFLEGVLKESHKNIQNIHLQKNGFEQQLEWGIAKGQEATIHHSGIKEVIARNQQIIFRNAEKIIADPAIVIDKLDFNKAVFTKEDIEKELEKSLLITLKNLPVNDKTALDIYIKDELVGLLDTVLLSPKLTLINPCDLKGRMLFAKTEQVELEQRFIGNINELAKRSEHLLSIKEEDIAPYAQGREFSNQQKEAIISICAGGDLSVLEGWPGAGKSTVTKEIARHYKNAGYEIIAAAPTNKAAQELESKLGVKTYTTSALRMKWQYERGASKVSLGLSAEYYKDPLYDLKEGVFLDKKTLLILDEASMLDVATSDYFVSEVKKSGAKLLSLGDNNQNQAIGSKGAFARMGEVGNYNVLTEVNRHQNTDLETRDLHIEATSALCNYGISKAISIYEQLGKVNIVDSEEEKEQAIARSYVSRVMSIAEDKSIDISEAAKQVVISSYTNAEIKSLNSLIRESLKLSGALTGSKKFIAGGVHGKSSMVELAVGDRIIFTSNLREEEGVGGVLNNELATVKKLLSVDEMGRGEFLADVEGASGIRRVLIRTGEEGRIVTFRHGYAVTNHAVQGASVPYKLYSVDQYSGYSSFLVGLTRHKLDCEIFAAKATLENEVYKTKDLDVEKVKEEYKAIGYEYILRKDEDGKDIQLKADIPLWKLGLHLLASKRSDMSFAIDASYNSGSIELQKTFNAHSQQLEALRKELNAHEEALGQYELEANTPIGGDDYAKDSKVDTKQKPDTKKDLTQFELAVSEHFNLKENIMFDVTDVVSAPLRFKNSNVGVDGHQLKVEDHLASLKAGIISGGMSSRLNWSDLSKLDQDLVLWSYINEESREKLTDHYNKARGLTEEIQDKAHAASGIWQELKDSGYKGQESLDGNYKVAKEYLAARIRVAESFGQSELLNKQLGSAKVQKLLIAEIENKYGIKLKFINTSMNGLEKAKEEFAIKKSDLDTERLADNEKYQANTIEQDRELYLKSLKGRGEFKEILTNSNLFVLDILESAKSGSELAKLAKAITSGQEEANAAKAERTRTASIMLDNWGGHVSKEFAEKQPSFAKILSALNVNYHTLSKHAGVNQERHYFENLTKNSLGTNADYQEIMHSIYKAQEGQLTTNDISSLLKAHDGLCEHVELVTEYIEELKGERLSVQNSLNSGLARIKTINTYRDTEFPHFIGTIYKEDSSSVIANLDSLLAKVNDKSQLPAVISENPEMLGSVKARGIVSRIFGSNEKQVVDANIGQIGDRVKRYIEGGMQMQDLQQVSGGNLANKLADIDKEIGVLRSSLPSSLELNILKEIGSLQDSIINSNKQDPKIGDFTKKINKLFSGDKAQDALFAYQTKHNVFFEEVTKEVKKREGKEQANAGSQDAENKLQRQLKQKSKAELVKQQNKEPRLTFDEVKAALSQSVVSEIFRNYAPLLNPHDKVEKLGSEIKAGSVHMRLTGSKVGLWNRFSDGSKGDIFTFVEEATGCSKYEVLEVVASHAGVKASTEIPHKNLAINARKQEEATQEVYGSSGKKDLWVANSIVPDSASEFNPEKDLSFLIEKGNVITHVHEYRNKDNQLLGHTVRAQEIETGRKQVLPVAYCENEHLKKARWQLKGFNDSGTKPIYGLEKLAQNPEKPILIVEGEKTADAASKLLPEHVVVSWLGGAQAVDKVDWSKLSGRVVSIWPDNDRPGIEAAKNIANHIDCRNGFSGLVSVVDTEKLALPKKWDLADEIPANSSLTHLSLDKVIESGRTESQALGDKLKVSQDITNNSRKNDNNSLDSIAILAEQGKIDNDEYAAKEMYHDTILLIAKSKNIELSNIKAPKEFINAVGEIQNEYQALHREYDVKVLQQQGNNIDTKEQLVHNLMRDTSVLQQLQLGVSKLTSTHSDHLAKTVNAEIEKLQRFNEADKEHAAKNVYKAINSREWRDELDAQNLEKAQPIMQRFEAINTETKQVSHKLNELEAQKQQATTVKQAMQVLKKEHEFLSEVGDSLKYPQHHSDQFKEKLQAAKEIEQNHTFEKLEVALLANQKQGVKSDAELASILQNPKCKISEIYENLHNMAKNERNKILQWNSHEINSLQKMNSKVDYDKLVNTLSLMSTEDQKAHINALTATETRKYVEPLLAYHAEEKSKSTNTKELLDAITKEQATYVHLHNDHGMAIYALDKSNGNMKLSIMASAANDIHKLGGIDYVKRVINHSIDHNIRTDKKIFDDLKNSEGNLKILSEDLHRECTNYHKGQIDRHLEDLSKDRYVSIGSHRFSDASKYLRHIKEHHNHGFMPTDHINRQLQRIEQKHEQEMQKELHLNKTMGGPNL